MTLTPAAPFGMFLVARNENYMGTGWSFHSPDRAQFWHGLFLSLTWDTFLADRANLGGGYFF